MGLLFYCIWTFLRCIVDGILEKSGTWVVFLGRSVHPVVVSVQLVYGYFWIVVLYLLGEDLLFIIPFKEVINCSLYLLWPYRYHC